MNPEKWKNAHLKRMYGITLEEYNQMKQEQNGKCAICSCEEKFKQNEKIKNLCVDHDHKTGEIRGLLCHRCNIALSVIEIYIKNPEKWDNYLQKFK